MSLPPAEGGRCRASAPTQSELELEAARRVATQFERWYDLEPGALLSLAWLGARTWGGRWVPGAGLALTAYMALGARYELLEAIRKGELDGSRRLRGGARSRPRPLPDEAASNDERLGAAAPWLAVPPSDPGARLDAEALLSDVEALLGRRSAMVLLWTEGEGRSQRDVAERLQVTQGHVSRLRARALDAARASVRRQVARDS